MTIKEIALDLWPAWMMGLAMLYMVKNSKFSKMLRVDKIGMLKFLRFLLIISVFRFLTIKFLYPQDEVAHMHELAKFLPWQVSFGVFWEDMCHAVPLALVARMFAKETWYKWARLPLLALVMFSFGSGHMYQGLIPALGISLYIPFTLKMGNKYGFGTVMICHMLYDLVTMLTMRAF